MAIRRARTMGGAGMGGVPRSGVTEMECRRYSPFRSEGLFAEIIGEVVMAAQDDGMTLWRVWQRHS